MRALSLMLGAGMLLGAGCAVPMQRACYETARTLVEEAQVLVAVPCEGRPAAEP